MNEKTPNPRSEQIHGSEERASIATMIHRASIRSLEVEGQAADLDSQQPTPLTDVTPPDDKASIVVEPFDTTNEDQPDMSDILDTTVMPQEPSLYEQLTQGSQELNVRQRPRYDRNWQYSDYMKSWSSGSERTPGNAEYRIAEMMAKRLDDLEVRYKVTNRRGQEMWRFARYPFPGERSSELAMTMVAYMERLHANSKWALEYAAETNKLLPKLDDTTQPLSPEEESFTNTSLFKSVQALNDPEIFDVITEIVKDYYYFGGRGVREQTIMDETRNKLAHPETYLATSTREQKVTKLSREATQQAQAEAARRETGDIIYDALGPNPNILQAGFYVFPPGVWTDSTIEKLTGGGSSSNERKFYESRLKGLRLLGEAASDAGREPTFILANKGLAGSKETPYVILELEYGGEMYAVAECPESGNATYIFRNGTNGQNWTQVFTKSRREALEAGASKANHAPDNIEHADGDKHMAIVLEKINQMYPRAKEVA